MKYSSLGFGLVFGTAAGLVISLFKDQNGQRLGAPLKKSFEETKNEASHLANSIHHAKEAAERLNQALPEAQRGIDDISSDIKNYQRNTRHITNEIEYQSQRLQDKFSSKTE